MSTLTPDTTERAKTLFFEALDRADAKDHAGAEERLRAALALVPDRPSILTNLAVVLFSQEKYGDALAFARQVLARAPDNAQAMRVAGNCLLHLERFAESAEMLQRVVAAAPDDGEAWAILANVHTETKRYDEALSAYRRALASEPDVDYLRGDYVHARMYAADWAGLEADWAALLADIHKGLPVARPFHMLSIPSTPADQLACARTWSRREYAAHDPLWQGERYAHDRIRLAYVCADFGGHHPITQLMAGLFEQHDRTRLETIAIATEPGKAGPRRERVAGAFEQFVEAGGKTDQEIAELVRSLEVDIAVDLNGHTANSRTGAFARRPAPIQVSYIAFPGSLGADFIDYMLADRIVLPEADLPHYTENVAWLPESYYITDDRAPTPATITSRADHGLPETGFVFCCFNNSYKITPDDFDVWMRLLNAVEGSVLWLLASNTAFSANLRREAEARGVAPSRLVFARRLANEAHLARHRHADLFLDTFHCNAHTTACDALWMGLPVITCLGTNFAGRVAASVLHAIGLPDLVTTSPEAYEALALALATRPAERADIAARLAANRRTHPLFDTKRLTRHIEAAYEGMMARHRDGAPPESFAVAPLP